MLKNLKNEILVKQSFSKVKNNIESIVDNTIHALRGGGKNLGGKSLVSVKYSFKTILFGLLISLLVLSMQCSKGSDPAVTPTPTATPDGTITCKIYETKNASDQCVTKTCPFGESLNASNGMCEAIICPSGQLLDASGNCADKDSFYTTCNGVRGLKGPSIMLIKYLNKTLPNPSIIIDPNNSDFAFIVARGCEESNPAWLTSQSIFNALSYFEILDTTSASLRFTNNPMDYNIVSLGPVGVRTFYNGYFIPKNSTGNKYGNAISFNYNLQLDFHSNNCIGSNCFIRINNSILTLPSPSTGINRGIIEYLINGTDEQGSRVLGTELRNSAKYKYNPLIKYVINDMYTAYSKKDGVTWTSAQLESVLLK